MKNTLADLNNYLFEQLERLNDDDCILENEIERAKAITSVATQIISNGNLVLKAKQLQKESLGEDRKLPPMLEG